jgi:hypothetical protein
MAIQPIDLQTLFTQMDKVGKTLADQKEGLALQQSIQGLSIQKKTELKSQSVNETQDAGEGAERIKDQNAKSGAGAEGEEKKKREEEKEGPPARPVIRDPELGKIIDLSG